jgi:hypothetical protein
MVSKEKGPKVERLGILSVVKNEKVLEFLDDLADIINFVEKQRKVEMEAEVPQELEEEEQEQLEETSFTSLDGSFSSLEQLNEGIRKLYKDARIKAGPPGSIEDFVGFVNSMLEEPSPDSPLISKNAIIKQTAKELAIEALRARQEVESRRVHPPRKPPPRHSDDSDSNAFGTTESAAQPPIPAHSPRSPQAAPVPPPIGSRPLEPKSRRRTNKLSLFKRRTYTESFDLQEGINRDIAKQKDNDETAGTTAPLYSVREAQPRQEKQKYSKSEVDTGAEKRKKSEREGPKGVGIKLEGFPLRCISKIPLVSESFNDILFASEHDPSLLLFLASIVTDQILPQSMRTWSGRISPTMRLGTTLSPLLVNGLTVLSGSSRVCSS